MTDSPSVLVDSNVIIDIISDDALWAEWSLGALGDSANPIVNPIVFAELCYQRASSDEVESLLLSLDLQYEELPKEALFLASQAYRAYRQQGGVKTAPLPDFFIGAHARVSGIPILTRDKSRYQTYFPGVALICP